VIAAARPGRYGGATTPQLRQFRYFVAVAEELHFGRAARKLYIAQPALSQAIAQLEHELGVRLLDRNSRHVGLTDAGRTFLDHARRTLDAADRAVEVARRGADGSVGSVRLGYSPLFRHSVLPTVVRAFAERFPDVHLRSQEMFSGPVVDALGRGELDVALVGFPPALPGVDAAPLIREPFVVAVAADTPLGRRERVALAELADETFLLWRPEVSPGLRDRVVELCRGAGFEPRGVEHVPEANADGRLIRERHGISLVPASARRYAFEGTSFVALEDGGAEFEGSVLWRVDAPAPALRFVDVALAAAAGHGWLEPRPLVT
jgi:DNA-binding transcriptional LysR family regulator